jgi:hypothetical protein
MRILESIWCCAQRRRTRHYSIREITGGTGGNKDNGKYEDKYRGNTYGKTRKQKQPRKVEASMNTDGADNHHISTT